MLNKIFPIYNHLVIDLKLKLIITLILLIIGTFFEALSIAVFIPILNFISDPESFNSIKKFLEKHLSFNIEHSDIIIYLIGSVLIIYLLRFVILNFVFFFQNQFIHKLHKSIYEKIYDSFLMLTIEEYKNIDHEKFINSLQIDLNRFSVFVRDFLYMITETFIILILTFVLVYNNPLGTLFLIIAGSPVLILFVYLMNKKLKIWGKENVEFTNYETKLILSSISFFKEINLYNMGLEFKKRLTNALKNHIKLWIKQGTVSQTIRFFIETYFIIIFILYLAFTYLVLERSINELILSSSLLSLVIIRMLPSINKIVSYSNNLKYNSESYISIINKLESVIEYKKKNIQKKKLIKSIEFKNIKFGYFPDKLLFDFKSIKFNKGDRILVSGKSGIGKSTLLEVLIGLINPQNRKVYIDNRLINTSLYEILDVGYVKQENILIYDTIKENITLNKLPINNNRYEIAKKIAHFENDKILLDDLRKHKNLKNKLSGGQKQRIAIARAYYFGMDVIIFDEATNSLDSKTEQKIFDNIKREKNLIFIYTTHSEKNQKYSTRKIELK